MLSLCRPYSPSIVCLCSETGAAVHCFLTRPGTALCYSNNKYYIILTTTCSVEPAPPPAPRPAAPPVSLHTEILVSATILLLLLLLAVSAGLCLRRRAVRASSECRVKLS